MREGPTPRGATGRVSRSEQARRGQDGVHAARPRWPHGRADPTARGGAAAEEAAGLGA